MKILTTELVQEIEKKMNNGERIPRSESIWHQNIVGIRKSNIMFAMTSNELDEYIKCKLSVNYFAENYCKIKLENGDFGIIKLRDYQKETIDLIDKNRFVINFASREVAITMPHAIFFLHYMLFNDDKIIYNISNKLQTSKEFLQRVKFIYQNLPFFLKKGVTNWNEKMIIFENGSAFMCISNIYSIGSAVDILYFQEFSKISDIDNIYKNIIPSIVIGGKIIINSGPNGFNFFYNLVTNSELTDGNPMKNSYKTLRTYWWQVEGRDQKWVEKKILMLGSKDLFEQEYNLSFISSYK